MPFRPRRVVTGTSAQGRSRVLHDGPAPCYIEPSAMPGMGCAMLWRTEHSPASNAGDADAGAGRFLPGVRNGGSAFFIIEYPPMAGLDEARRRELQAGALPADFAHDAQRHPGSHKTDTLDYIVVLRGEITLILDEGEVLLRAGDTVIDRGVWHAWENRGSKPALMASIMLDAQALAQG